MERRTLADGQVAKYCVQELHYPRSEVPISSFYHTAERGGLRFPPSPPVAPPFPTSSKELALLLAREAFIYAFMNN